MPAGQPFQPWLLEQLRNAPELALDYLNAALDENDPATFVLALKNVVEAQRGIEVMREVSDHAQTNPPSHPKTDYPGTAG